jgi:ribonuclease M5
MRILETIIVEGRNDESALLAAVEANVICTHGYGIKKETLDLIETAYKTTGIIIFTDPDYAGDEIRKRLTGLYPNAKQAFLARDLTEKEGDVGIENASTENIIFALEMARAISMESSGEFTVDDMFRMGLTGLPDSAKKRKELGNKLGIGSANCKSFLKRLNFMGIKKTDIEL